MKENAQKIDEGDLSAKIQQLCDDITGKPFFGNVLTVLSGLLFMLVCMLLPLVGPAGSAVEFSDKNFVAFLSVLTLTLLVSGASSAVNILRRNRIGGSIPCFPIGLFCVTVLAMIVLGLGLFRI